MKLFKIHESDNVAVAIETIGSGECVETGGETVRANMEIPAGHKIALADIGEGEAVVKYGCPIGLAGEDQKGRLDPCTQYQDGTWRSSHLFL